MNFLLIIKIFATKSMICNLEIVEILLSKSTSKKFSHLVFDFSSVVFDNKCIFLFLWLFVEGIVPMDGVVFLQKSFICGSRKAKKKEKNIDCEQKLLKHFFFYSSTYLQRSSRMQRSPVGLDSNKCKHPELSINSISRHLIPSRLYSFCSYLNTWRLK